MKTVTCILVGFMLVGCSALPSQEDLAQQNEWRQIGLLDGQAGHYQKNKLELTKLSLLSTAAIEEYKQGYHQGIEHYCQPEEAYQRGLDGVAYNGMCAGTNREDMAVQRWMEGYDDAFTFFYF